jgi:hypothetical protein
MSTLEELKEKNTPYKWPDTKEANYVAVDKNFVVTYFYRKPRFDGIGCFHGENIGGGTVYSPISRLSMQIAITHGVENSLLERPCAVTKFWQPERGDKYYIPKHTVEYGSFFDQCRWINDGFDHNAFNKGIVFSNPKYARWVARDGKDPFILQAAIAINGIASAENIFDRRSSYDVGYIYKYYNLVEQKWEAIPGRMGRIYEPHRVYFKSPDHAEEALKVVIPTGETLYDYLKGK